MKKTKLFGLPVFLLVLLVLLVVLIIAMFCTGCSSTQKSDETTDETTDEATDEATDQATDETTGRPAESTSDDQMIETEVKPIVQANDLKKEIIGNWALLELTVNGEIVIMPDEGIPSFVYSFTDGKSTFYGAGTIFEVTYRWIDGDTIEITAYSGEDVDEEERSISKIKIEGDKMFMDTKDDEHEQSGVLVRYSGPLPSPLPSPDSE